MIYLLIYFVIAMFALHQDLVMCYVCKYKCEVWLSILTATLWPIAIPYGIIVLSKALAKENHDV